MPFDFQNAIADPSLHFSTPETVLTHPDFSTDQKREILKSWERDAIRLQESEAEGFMGGERSQLDAIERALESIGRDATG